MSYRGNRKTRRRRRTRRGWSRLLLTNLLLLFALALVLRAGAALSRGETLKGEDGASNEVTKEGEEPTGANGTKEADDRGNTPGAETSAAGKSKKTEQWNLILVNPWNEVPEDYEVKLTRLRNGQAVDSRCYPMLQQMMDDCRADGLNPYICASYRTMKKQKALFADKVKRVLLEGCPKDEAEDEAAKTVARPGTSEHQLGLALDIVDADDPQLETWQEDTPVQQWLMKNSWKYGFVLRYPPEKSSITGIIYEPWHYRYVGRQAAEEMYTRGLCLEEYLKEREEG